MNRLKILLVVSALIAGSSAVASAEEYHQDKVAIQVRIGGNLHVGDGYFGFRGGNSHDEIRYRQDHDRDRDDRWRRDRDDRRGYDRDHDGDRR